MNRAADVETGVGGWGEALPCWRQCQGVLLITWPRDALLGLHSVSTTPIGPEHSSLAPSGPVPQAGNIAPQADLSFNLGLRVAVEFSRSPSCPSRTSWPNPRPRTALNPPNTSASTFLKPDGNYARAFSFFLSLFLLLSTYCVLAH